jgi:hypothetical protein
MRNGDRHSAWHVRHGRGLSLALAVALVFAAGGWTVHRLDVSEEREARWEVRADRPATDIGAFLRSPTLDATVGGLLFFNDVRVTAGPKPGVFFLRDGKGNRLLAQWQGAKADLPPQGAVVDVSGLLRRLPSSWVLTREWKLGKQEARQVGNEEVYLEVVRIEHERSGSGP